ncbi:hypothetical protein NCG89_09480 [Spongiibacter taiwanensis]|uniref:hypothetical protein n=1 Tax=Spongiibacter taiwanensis TaxID=1748242 RepID=UPI0020351C1E|nr:hypothetical protein [Spongiibacter taiwanensis]USA41748.1 hypothetical protein NCG89_09480 [Spongiibacter taiwanensis]
MKTATSAMMLLLASTLATANEPQQKAADQSLVIAYNTSMEVEQPRNEVEVASEARTDRALSETLGLVSATLSVELDEKIGAKLPTFAK